jgi:hypothetical protein
MVLPATRAVTAGLLILGAVRPATAQTPEPAFAPPRGDAAAYFGWFGANKSELNGYDDWYKRVWYGGLSTGFYWNENIKTEVDYSGTSRGEIYEIPPVFEPGGFDDVTDHEFSTKRVAIAQQYQFFHNAWFHPMVGGGVAVTWETTERTFPPIFGRDGRPVQAERHEGPETRVRAMAFASTGFKAYFSGRGFFRSDLRLGFTDRVEDVTVRFGFGLDF